MQEGLRRSTHWAPQRQSLLPARQLRSVHSCLQPSVRFRPPNSNIGPGLRNSAAGVPVNLSPSVGELWMSCDTLVTLSTISAHPRSDTPAARTGRPPRPASRRECLARSPRGLEGAARRRRESNAPLAFAPLGRQVRAAKSANVQVTAREPRSRLLGSPRLVRPEVRWFNPSIAHQLQCSSE